MGVAAKVAAEKVAVKAVKAEKAVVVKAVVAMDLVSHRLSTTSSSPRIKPLCHCCSSCRRPPCGSEKKIAQSSLPRGDGAAALFHRPRTAQHRTSPADRHHSDLLNRCRFISQTAAAQRMTMSSFVLPPSCWRGWAGPP